MAKQIIVESLPKEAKPIPTLPTYYITPSGDVYRDSFKTGRSTTKVITKIKAVRQGNKYMVFQPYVDGKKSLFYIHRAVALTHIGLPLEGQEVDHIDRNKINNHVSNLRWVSRSQNMLNKEKYKTYLNGRKSKRIDDARQVVKLWKHGVKPRNIAKELDLDIRLVRGMLCYYRDKL